MPNSTVPAAATGLPSRRLFLAKGTAATVFGAVTAAASSTAMAAPADAAPSAELLRLIEAHRVATDAYLKARDRYDEAEKICATAPTTIPFRWVNEPDIPISLGFEACLARAKTIVRLGISATRDGLAALPAKRQKQITAAVRGALKDTHKIVRDTFAKAEEIRRASGIEEAERDLSRADEAENNALDALCRFECATLKEMRFRAEYLATLDHDRLTADCIIALLPAAGKGEA